MLPANAAVLLCPNAARHHEATLHSVGMLLWGHIFYLAAQGLNALFGVNFWHLANTGTVGYVHFNREASRNQDTWRPRWTN